MTKQLKTRTHKGTVAELPARIKELRNSGQDETANKLFLKHMDELLGCVNAVIEMKLRSDAGSWQSDLCRDALESKEND